MFFIHNLTGVGRPYMPGAVTRNRVVDRVTAVPVVDSVVQGKALEGAVPPVDSRKQRYERAASRQERRVLLYARDIMSTPVVTIQSSESIYEGLHIMRMRRYRHLPVVLDSQVLVGVLSDRDVLKFMSERGSDPIRDMHSTVKDVMASEVIAAAPDAEIREIARVMFEDHIGSVPVVSPEGKVEGIVTRSDILRALMRNAPLELWG